MALVMLLALYALVEGFLMLALAIGGKPREPLKVQPA
jgi:hypothetical protein